jgi:threonine/homoserine/homoserine lactone efflux protein
MVTPWVLPTVYYLGALLMPFLGYGLFRRAISAFREGEGERSGDENRPFLRSWKLRLLMLLAFVMGELAWRIFIEFFVAYFQIRDALIG